ncbi:Ig-specific serine endopeptidase MIP [[Mycoplasma] gypis]|uniref:DUF31 domain-containing protein n=1 Tax=[Mycoplasma] gypis TaxID=92404 RepID=A0ABZ2RU87_9BACT|nr:hypothetical protein [[Mycoplasma] gypis]MBN0919014.1 hypothetical protein [[Mycoplasma] gypis]
MNNKRYFKNFLYSILLFSASTMTITFVAAACDNKNKDKFKPEQSNPKTQPEQPNSNPESIIPSNPGVSSPTPNPGDDVETEPSTSGFNSSNTQPVNTINPTGPKDEEAYNRLSQKEKNTVDVNNYVSALRAYLEERGIKPAPEAPFSNYNAKAIQNNQSTWEDAYYRNFSIYQKDGIYLEPLNISTPVKAYWKATPNNYGKARYLPNELYKKIALQSYQIEIVNSNKLIDPNSLEVEKGTAWILDYKTEEGKEYPTTWYLATNLHVAQRIIKSQEDKQTNYTNISKLQEEKDKITPIKEKIKQYEEEFNHIKETQGEKAAFESSAIMNYNKYSNELKKLLKTNFGETEKINLYHFNEDTPLNQKLDVTNLAVTVDRFSFEPSQVKLIYAANNFMNTSPSEYVSSLSKYKNYEEAADFAVLEFKFDQRNNEYKYFSQDKNSDVSVSNASELAKKATANYANWDSSEKVKFASSSVLEDYEKLSTENVNVTINDNKTVSVPKIKVDFLALGFPNAQYDYQLTKEDRARINGDSIFGQGSDKLKYTTSIWINKPKDLPKIFTKDLGSGLSSFIGYRTFTNNPGITDITLSVPIIDSLGIGGGTFNIGNVKDKTSNYKQSEYINFGLGYNLSNWQPLQGASGSSVRDVNGYLYGINFATADSSLTTITQAFRSEGRHYDGLYGKYNLAQYDLIYGGGKDQRTSYRQALKDAYGKNYKTALFSNGTDDAYVPVEYRFMK